MSHPQTPPFRSLQQFVDDLPRLLAACAYAHRELSDDVPCLVESLERRVELCDESGREPVAHCRNHYAYWGLAGLGGPREQLRETLKRNFERPLLELYDALSQARFGAWLFEPGDESTSPWVEPIDGTSEEARRMVVHATTTDASTLRRRAVVAGWLVEVAGLTLLVLACEFDERAQKKLRRAADRHAWGTDEQFRAADYQADLLALLFEPLCVDLGADGVCIRPDREQEGGRVFLSPLVKGWGWGLTSMDLPGALQQHLLDHGLTHRGESMPWHLAVAHAETASDIEQLLEQLVDVRRSTINDALKPRHPIGPHTLEVLISSRELMETVGLSAEGALDEHEAYLDLTLRQLGVDCAELWRCGLQPEMRLEETLRDTAILSPRALDSLGDAIQLARVRVRWRAVLHCWLDVDSPWQRIPSLVDLLSAIELLFRAELWQMPVRQLPDEGRGTWARIEAGMRQAGFRRARLRLSDLFECLDLLPDLPGVGPKTLEQAALGIAELLLDWPSGPYWGEESVSRVS